MSWWVPSRSPESGRGKDPEAGVGGAGLRAQWVGRRLVREKVLRPPVLFRLDGWDESGTQGRPGNT